MANIAQMINVLQAMIFTQGDKMILTPTYHVFRMYVPFQDAASVPVSLRRRRVCEWGHPLASGRCRRSQGPKRKIVGCCDQHRCHAPCHYRNGCRRKAHESCAGDTLAAPHLDSVNTFDAPHTVEPKAIAARVEDGKVVFMLHPHQ